MGGEESEEDWGNGGEESDGGEEDEEEEEEFDSESEEKREIEGEESEEFDSENESDSDSDNDSWIRRERWIKHYSSSQRILLVGEGDFSFSLSLAKAFGSATNMVATSLDNKESLANKYDYGILNVRKLEELGALALHEVDVMKMSEHFFLKTQRFDRIVYNFPHVGFKYPEGSNFQIEEYLADRLSEESRLNKKLVKGFLKNAKTLLRQNGEIHITHKTGQPYDQWNLEKKAEKNGLILKNIAEFKKDDYPGYANKRAHGSRPDDPFCLGECFTYKFIIK